MQTFKKDAKTGMHKTLLRKGSSVNGTTLEKDTVVVLRPGNTVICDVEDLGISGRKQFTLISPALPEEPEEPQEGLVIAQRSPGYFNVVNPVNPDKPFNDKALRKGAAEELLKELNNPGPPSTGSDTDSDTDKFDKMDWDDLVGELASKDIELEDEWETGDDLREVLRNLQEEK